MIRYLWGLIAAIVIGVGAPLLEIAFACRNPSSEGCVWGRALLPVNIAATLLILGTPTFLIVVRILGRRSKNGGSK